MSRNRAIFLLVLVPALLYLRSFWAPFAYDDYLHFVENPKILHPHSVGDVFKNGLQETRPVYNFTLATQAVLFGTDPMPAHIFSVALHILVGIALYLLFLRINLAPALSFLAALLFLIHPIAVESVAYVNSRSGLLALLFSFCALHFWLSDHPKRFVWGFWAAALAIGSKEDAALVVPVALLLFFWTRKKLSVKTIAALVAPVITLPLLYLVFRSPHHHTVGSDVAFWPIYLWQQGFHIPLHLSLFVCPWPLSPDRDISPIWLASSIVATGWVLLGLIAAAVWCARRTAWALGLAWAILALLPTHSVVPLLDLQASRLLYPALPGLALAFSALLFAIPPKSRLLAIFLCFTFFSWRTTQQIDLWSHPLELWKKDVTVAPSRWRAWLNLSVEHAERKEWEEAFAAILKAKEVDPNESSVFYNIAAIAAYRTDGKKDPKFARTMVERALALNPNHVRSKRLLKYLNQQKNKNQ